MDEWKMRWCPVAGEPIANNLVRLSSLFSQLDPESRRGGRWADIRFAQLFYFYSSKLFLNSIPLHTMLRKGDVADDPECVSTTINAAKSILDLAHKVRLERALSWALSDSAVLTVALFASLQQYAELGVRLSCSLRVTLRSVH
jgi:hypothetical protein